MTVSDAVASLFQFMKFVKKLRDEEYKIENNQACEVLFCPLILVKKKPLIQSPAKN